MMLLRRAVEVWLRIPSNIHHERDDFVRLFGSFWKEFEPAKALAIARRIVAQDLEEPDAAISANYETEVRFTSTRQHALFQILHVLLHVDPALAQSLIHSHDQLAASVRRYPNGLETMLQEMAAAAERRKAEGATGAGCYIMGGDAADFGRIRRLKQATQSGDFEPSVEDAIGKYQIDTSPANPNEAPKEYWPSTAAFRTLLYQAGKRLGPDAGKLLDRIPDEDICLFATIELAAALAGLPESPMMQMKRQRPADSPRRRIPDVRGD